MGEGIGRRVLALVLDATAVAGALAVSIAALALGDNPVTARPSTNLAAMTLGLAPVAVMTAAAYTLSRLRPRAWLLVAGAILLPFLLDTSPELPAAEPHIWPIELALAALIGLVPVLAAYAGIRAAGRRPGQELGLVAAKLDAIEAELRRLGYWLQTPPAVPPHSSFASGMPFEHWLQLVFLPNARRAVASRQLPDTSQVGLMAIRQYDYHSHVPEAQTLVSLLNEFDALVRFQRARVRRGQA